jgi:hypothetical protein
MERMNDERMTKIIYRAERKGERRRGTPRIGWMEGIENILKEGVRSTKCRRACKRGGEGCVQRQSEVAQYPLCLPREGHGVMA